jgi:hypothetical protein
MAGVFARLKIQDPRAVATIPLSRENHPVTVPITFNKLPTYLDRVWDTMHHAEYNSMVRNCGKFFSSFYSYLFLRQIVVETNTRMRSKISGNFIPSRCITNDNLIVIICTHTHIYIPGVVKVHVINLNTKRTL